MWTQKWLHDICLLPCDLDGRCSSSVVFLAVFRVRDLRVINRFMAGGDGTVDYLDPLAPNFHMSYRNDRVHPLLLRGLFHGTGWSSCVCLLFRVAVVHSGSLGYRFWSARKELVGYGPD